MAYLTRAQLRTELRISLDDVAAAVYTNAEIDHWINESLRAYGTSIPIVTTSEVSLSNTNEVNLPLGFRQMLHIWLQEVDGVTTLYYVYEPPTQNPIMELTRLDHRHNQFQHGDYYDLIFKEDTAVLITGRTYNQDLLCQYIATPTEPTADGDSIRIPPAHYPILHAYTVSAAARRKELSEAVSGGTGSVYEIGQAARDAETHYWRMLNEARVKVLATLPQSITANLSAPLRYSNLATDGEKTPRFPTRNKWS